MRKFYTTLKMDFIFSGLRRLICHLCSGPEFIKIKLQKVQSFYLMIFIMLLSGTTIVKSQTTLSAGDILITSFDATKTVTDDKFSFVTLKDLQPNTVIYFTDRGYFGNNTWQSANGGTEGSISWSLGSDNVAAGTEVVIQSLSAKVNNVAKGSVASIAGSNANGLSLSSPSGDQIIAFQGGAGNPAAIGVTMIGGFHWNYCPIDYYSVYTTDASWDTIGVNSACSAGPNSSNMPPGLNASTAFWVGFFKPTPPAKNIQNYTKGQFNGAGAPFSSLAALKAAILNRNNWTALKYDDPTVVNVPTGYTFYSACTAPAITSQPSASTICAESNTTFSAVFSNATGYQWQVDRGAGFINISNTAPYSGANTATLTITGATAGINGYAYRVVATGACSPAATSNSATLTVNSAPAITSQPNASAICAGSNTTFSAVSSNATGYQWQVNQGAGFINISNTAPYSGANTATLTITGATAGINGYAYRVIATGSCSPAATSNSAKLTVNSAPAITSQPSASTICAGANTIFTAAASNATGYQWQVDQGAGFINISNGAPYSGATTATLTITGATAGINGYAYRVVATGSCSPAATSNSATLTVSSVTGSATKNNVSCNGGSNGSITLTPSGGTAPYTYNWGGGILTKDRVGLTAGIYTVTIKDANGCTGNVSVTIIEPALLVATAGAQTNVSCNGGATGSATVKVTGGTGSYTYSWSPSGGTAATANGLAAGTYLVTITDTNGCQTTQSFTITQAELVAAPTGVATQSFNPGDTLSVLVVNGQGIKWYATPNDVINHVNALPTTTVIVNNKTYYATQTISGCESKTSLAVLAYNETLGVNNASKGIKLQVYPNPVNDVLHFIGEDKITKIVIISIDGKKISEKTMSNERRLNVHTLIQGTYLINIFTDRGLQTIKFIKK